MLIANTIVSSAFLFGYSFFRPTTPHVVIFLALLAGGFFRSLQMTSLNTLSYADVPAGMLSRATSLTSMAQQLSQSVGVGTGALVLYVMLSTHGTAVSSAADSLVALADGRRHFAAVGAVLPAHVARCRAPRSAAALRRASRPIDARQMTLRLFAWNIRQGGGTGYRAIAAAIARHDADVLVISEYRGGDSG